MTPAGERKLRARIAINTRWANTADRVAATQPARNGFMARFERQVDPDGTLAPEERSKRADAAMRAHMSALALKRAKTRPPKQTPA